MTIFAITKMTKPASTVGAPSKFPFAKLEIGEGFIVPWNAVVSPTSNQPLPKAQLRSRMKGRADYYALSLNRKFIIGINDSDELVVYREQ